MLQSTLLNLQGFIKHRLLIGRYSSYVLRSESSCTIGRLSVPLVHIKEDRQVYRDVHQLLGSIEDVVTLVCKPRFDLRTKVSPFWDIVLLEVQVHKIGWLRQRPTSCLRELGWGCFRNIWDNCKLHSRKWRQKCVGEVPVGCWVVLVFCESGFTQLGLKWVVTPRVRVLAVSPIPEVDQEIRTKDLVQCSRMICAVPSNVLLLTPESVHSPNWMWHWVLHRQYKSHLQYENMVGFKKLYFRIFFRGTWSAIVIQE